jgi:hypothetical protein
MGHYSTGGSGSPRRPERSDIGQGGYPASRFFEEAGIVLLVSLGIAVLINLAAVIASAA